MCLFMDRVNCQKKEERQDFYDLEVCLLVNMCTVRLRSSVTGFHLLFFPSLDFSSFMGSFNDCF